MLGTKKEGAGIEDGEKGMLAGTVSSAGSMEGTEMPDRRAMAQALRSIADSIRSIAGSCLARAKPDESSPINPMLSREDVCDPRKQVRIKTDGERLSCSIPLKGFRIEAPAFYSVSGDEVLFNFPNQALYRLGGEDATNDEDLGFKGTPIPYHKLGEILPILKKHARYLREWSTWFRKQKAPLAEEEEGKSCAPEKKEVNPHDRDGMRVAALRRAFIQPHASDVELDQLLIIIG